MRARFSDPPAGSTGDRRTLRLREEMRPRGVHRLYRQPWIVRGLARHFHRAYFYNAERTLFETSWLGVPAVKYPADMWIYQELLTRLRPELVVEAGTFMGGSALFLATVCDALGCGRVITIDTAISGPAPPHPRIDYMQGSSTDPEVLASVATAARESTGVLVILDSDHSRDHVLAELRAYAPLVSEGSYVVVEDTNLNGYPVLPGWGAGPTEAAAAFLRERPDFEVDRSLERFLVTANPRGFLRRRRAWPG